MNIVIVYATNSGSCFLVAEMLTKILSKKHNVTVQTAQHTKPSDLEKFDCIILGSPSWSFEKHEGYPHEAIVALIQKAEKKDFSEKLFAIYGCGDTSYTFFCGAVDHLVDFVLKVGGKQLVEPLRIDGYFFDPQKNNELVEKWTRELLKKIK